MAFLGKLEELQGDVLVYLHEDYRECILKHPVLLEVKNRPGVMSLHGHEFLIFVHENQNGFYGSLLSEGFRCRGTVDGSNQQEYLIRNQRSLLTLKIFPKSQTNGQYSQKKETPQDW